MDFAQTNTYEQTEMLTCPAKQIERQEDRQTNRQTERRQTETNICTRTPRDVNADDETVNIKKRHPRVVSSHFICSLAAHDRGIVSAVTDGRPWLS